MPGSQTGVPMTHVHQNRQFILVAVNGQPAGQLAAFTFPRRLVPVAVVAGACGPQAPRSSRHRHPAHRQPRVFRALRPRPRREAFASLYFRRGRALARPSGPAEKRGHNLSNLPCDRPGIVFCDRYRRDTADCAKG